MNTTNNMQNRLSGLALILGSALGMYAQLFHPADPETAADLPRYAQAGMPIHLLLYFGVMLILLGLPALHARQSDKTGALGLAGFLLLFFGLPLVDLIHSVVFANVLETLVAGTSPDQALALLTTAFSTQPWVTLEMLGNPLLGLGILLFGIATIRARVFPSWNGWLLIGALILNFGANFLPQVGGASYGGIALYLSMVGFGYALLSGQQTVPQPATAAAFK